MTAPSIGDCLNFFFLMKLSLSDSHSFQIGEYEETIGTCFAFAEDGETRYVFCIILYKIA